MYSYPSVIFYYTYFRGRGVIKENGFSWCVRHPFCLHCEVKDLCTPRPINASGAPRHHCHLSIQRNASSPALHFSCLQHSFAAHALQTRRTCQRRTRLHAALGQTCSKPRHLAFRMGLHGCSLGTAYRASLVGLLFGKLE